MVRVVDRCRAEYHAHLDEKCLGVLTQCWKDEDHDMRGWHRNPEGDVSWNYDSRDKCPNDWYARWAKTQDVPDEVYPGTDIPVTDWLD